MAESVVAVGYVLRDEAVRLVETRSFAHNEVVTSNTKAFEVWFCLVFFIFCLLILFGKGVFLYCPLDKKDEHRFSTKKMSLSGSADSDAVSRHH